MTAHVMEDSLFSVFQRPSHPPSSSSSSSYHPLTASDLLNRPSISQYKCRPASDILQTQPTMKKKSSSPEAEDIDRWFENIQRYEHMLEQVAAASLDQGFKDELQSINQWFQCRSDAERTAAFYTVVQNASQIQIRFLITVLEQIENNNSTGSKRYPAGQENVNNNNVQQLHQQQMHRSPFSSRSVISASDSASDFDYTGRKRHPPSSRNNNTRRFTSAISEPDDLRRRNRDLFVSRPLGLSHPGPLYEKAIAARAQIQALSGGITSNSSTSSSSSSSNNGSTGGLFSSPPRLRTSCSTTDLSTKSLFSNTDWPFPISTKSSSNDDSWSFGSLGNTANNHTNTKRKLTSAPGSTVGSSLKKDDILPWAIQEEEQEYSKLSATISSSLSALEQAQARLRQDTSLPVHKKTPITQWTPPSMSPAVTVVATTNTTTTTTTATAAAAAVTITAAPLPPSPPVTMNVTSVPASAPLSGQIGLLSSQSRFGHFLTPPQHDDHNSDDEQSDSSGKEKPLTGLARRRKRSSAARALKDKLAAETVDFELMKDVQNWLRSLRLHKYGHAFIGLDWHQVVRMSDQDMIDAGVNTIGARRKLLKVFENVVRHCQENNLEY